ncbi:MAG: SHD1 domain-containing protein [Verrucomicrobiota bacterium]
MTRTVPLFLLFLAIAHGHEVREWTDADNRKVRAEFVKLKSGTVFLKLTDGREANFPLEKLSAADRNYISGLEPAAAKPNSNFEAPWPDLVRFQDDPEITTIAEDADAKKFIYESANYRYTCDVRLSNSVVKGFAVLFEATNRFCQELPIGMASGRPAGGKHQIVLFEQSEDYHKAGGIPGSAGVFVPHLKSVLIPLPSLGVRPVGSGYMLDRDKTNKTVPHELTHQLTPEVYYDDSAIGWFTEGLAEYVAVTPYRGGGFNLRNNRRAFMEYVTGYGRKEDGGRGLGEEIKLGPLKNFMTMPYEKFMANGQVNYGCSLLITSYFFHMDGDGDGARIKRYLKDLRAGKSGQEATNVLLDGRSYEQIEKEIAKAWGRYGIEIDFSS